MKNAFSKNAFSKNAFSKNAFSNNVTGGNELTATSGAGFAEAADLRAEEVYQVLLYCGFLQIAIGITGE